MPHFPKPFFRASRKLWYVEVRGKQINLGRDKEQAFKKYHQILAAEQDQQPVCFPDNALVVVLCDTFLGWVEKHRSAATYGWYQQRLQSFASIYATLTINELKPFHVQLWVDAMSIGQTTRRNYDRVIKCAIKWSKQQGYINENPIAELEAPSAERREDTISPQQFEKMLTVIPCQNFRDLLTVSFETGCRPQEIRAVEARHFDAKNKLWLFPKSESKMKRKARVVYLTDKAVKICSRLAKLNPNGVLFTNANGKPWTSDACQADKTQLAIGNQQPMQPSQER